MSDHPWKRIFLVSQAVIITFYSSFRCYGFSLPPRYQQSTLIPLQHFQNSHSFSNLASSTSDGAITSSPSTDQSPHFHTMLQEIHFDDNAWEAYTIAMEQMFKRPGVVKKTKDHEIAACSNFLLSRHGLAPISVRRPVDGPSFHQALEEQGTRFQQHYNFTKQEHEFITRCLVYVGDFCAKPRGEQEAKFDRRDPIVVSWYKLKEMGWMPRENSFSTYMYILSNASEEQEVEDKTGDSSSSTTSSVYDDALLEIVTCHGQLYGSNEKTVAIQLKNMIRRGDVEGAEDLLASLENEAQQNIRGNVEESSQDLGLRLRTFLPLMEHYCRIGDGKAILRLFHRMQEAPGTYFDADAYAMIVASLAHHGYFRPGKEDADEEFGPRLFDKIVSSMAEDVLDLTPETVAVLEKGFQMEYSEGTIIDRTVVEHVTIASNCTCPKTGAKLRLLKLNDNQRQHVHDTLKEMARLSSQEFLQKVNQRNKANGQPEVASSPDEESTENRAYEAISNFSEWLDTRDGKPYTSIVDGANVAYYGHSNVHYSSLRAVVERLVGMGENPLVVMPSKYVQNSFRVGRNGHYQTLTERELGTLTWLREEDMIYVVPRLCLDDYFWMLASVSNQTKSRQGQDLTVPMKDELGRFPGMRPMIITNDQMRDHKLNLLEPREFRRWCSCHIVNYHLNFYEADEWEDRLVQLEPADYFSREIQGNPHPTGGGDVWHFPISNSTDWLCIWLEQSHL
ncbi:protein-only RNase P [Nitzschia inconspicua]|uniref:Protein-only RNase P n=1 Tax=Nitzschia inconspicua TaxID=303405 RepID=A0A9K3KMA1_9STRA|nr:protein-only RNase P [Nitzschia inconspicua]